MARKRMVLMAAVVACSWGLACRGPGALDAIRDGDFSLVEQGSYAGRLIILTEGMEQFETALRLRLMVEENMDVLDSVSDRCHTLEHVGYRFKYAAFDAERNALLLRYFARIVEHPLYAGYQIQLRFDADSRRLIRVYTEEVPLE